MNKLIIFLTFSLLAAFNSYGNWSPIIKTKFGSIHYVDMDSVKTNEQYIYYWAMENSVEPDMFGALSKAWYIKADCDIHKYKILSTVLYKAKDGKQRFNTFNKSHPFKKKGGRGELTYM